MLSTIIVAFFLGFVNTGNFMHGEEKWTDTTNRTREFAAKSLHLG
jgi:hypothetical protein